MLLLLRVPALVVVALVEALRLVQQWFALALVSIPEYVLVPVVVVPNCNCFQLVLQLEHERAFVGVVVTLVDCIGAEVTAR